MLGYPPGTGSLLWGPRMILISISSRAPWGIWLILCKVEGLFFKWEKWESDPHAGSMQAGMPTLYHHPKRSLENFKEGPPKCRDH